MNLKNILKSLKLHESTFSMILGGIVILVLGVTIVRYFQASRQGTTGPGSNTEETQPIVTRGEGPVTYIAGQGESLWSIAEKQYGSGYNWVDISNENSLSDPNTISDGQELVIPDVEPKQRTAEAEMATAEEISQNAITGATYTVTSGDNLWNIAVRAYGDGYQWVNIAKENELENPNIIHQGNVLSLPR